MILEQIENNLTKFNEIYETDRFMARVYALEKTPSISYVVLNDVSQGVFQIFFDINRYGVSTTLKKYYHKKSMKKIFVNKGRFHIMYGKVLKPLTLRDIDEVNLKSLFIERFSWVRFLDENNFRDLPLNSVVRHKLYSKNKVLRYLYKVPPSKAMLIAASRIHTVEWKRILKDAYNAENINPELLENDSTLNDAIGLAHKLNEKVNLSWSLRRLKEEHDKWSKIYTKIVIEMDNEPLSISQVYLDFNEFIGGGLITQSGGLAQEGFLQSHCVASYKNSVNNGTCAIFHIDGFTAEIRYSSQKKIYINQFKGLRNCIAPEDLNKRVQDKINDFNKSIKGKTYPVKHQISDLEVFDANYPF